MSVEVIRVSKQYPGTRALDEVSFRLDKGEIVGFLGPNGAGKTTMMKILSGAISSFEGEVNVSGIPVKKQALEVKKITGYLPEHNPLYPGMYVREYLRFIAGIHRIPRSRIPEVMELTGLLSHKEKKIKQLSKGYRQRVGIASVLLHDPEVLIMDEPTTGLDPNQIVEIRELIRRIGKDKTVLFSTHILREVEALCDRVIILDRGKKIADYHMNDMAAGGEIRIRISLDTIPSEQHFESLEGLSLIQTKGNTALLSIRRESYHDTLLFDWAVENGYKITGLEVSKENLEQIFLNLTGKQPSG